MNTGQTTITTRLFRVLVAALAAPLFAGCGGGGSSDENIEASFDYPAATYRAAVFVPMSVRPVVSGLNGHQPIFQLTAGTTLPVGLALNRDSGEISGTPLEKGDTLIPVELSVSGFDGTLLGVARVEVATPYSLNYPSAVYGVVGRAYQAAPPTVAGLTAVDTVRYELATGAMPPGLTLNAQTGLISGTPTAVTVEGFLQVRMTVTRGSMATTAVTFLSYGIQAR